MYLRVSEEISLAYPPDSDTIHKTNIRIKSNYWESFAFYARRLNKCNFGAVLDCKRSIHLFQPGEKKQSAPST